MLQSFAEMHFQDSKNAIPWQCHQTCENRRLQDDRWPAVPEDNTNSLEQFKIIDQYEKEIFLSCCELLPLFSQNDFHLLRNQSTKSKKFGKIKDHSLLKWLLLLSYHLWKKYYVLVALRMLNIRLTHMLHTNCKLSVSSFLGSFDELKANDLFSPLQKPRNIN